MSFVSAFIEKGKSVSGVSSMLGFSPINSANSNCTSLYLIIHNSIPQPQLTKGVVTVGLTLEH